MEIRTDHSHFPLPSELFNRNTDPKIWWHMVSFPFQLSIKCIFPKGKKESLECQTLLRSIPGNRDVYDALWNDKAVIVKAFSHKIRAKRHLRREWKGVSSLYERNLSAMKPFFYGRTDDHRWAVVIEKILNSVPAIEIFEKLTEKTEKYELLRIICREIAKQHEKGVMQKDFHLGNFLVRDQKSFSVDPGQMKFFPRPLSRKNSLLQLAMLACFLPDNDAASVEGLYHEYLFARKWQEKKSDKLFIQKHRKIFRKKAIHRGLRKTLRTSKRYQRIRSGEYLAVHDKNLSFGDKPIKFLNQIDALMTDGSVLKNGNTCCVSKTFYNNKWIVIKRYNDKGLFHSVRHTIKGSRACRSWLHGHRLGMLHIPTPQPLAYIEVRKNLIIKKSYLITAFTEGITLHDLLRDKKVTEDQRTTAIHQTMNLINKLGQYRISHGDLKHSNIIITDKGPVITDLDSMQINKCRWKYKKRRTKDFNRFSK